VFRTHFFREPSNGQHEQLFSLRILVRKPKCKYNHEVQINSRSGEETPISDIHMYLQRIDDFKQAFISSVEVDREMTGTF